MAPSESESEAWQALARNQAEIPSTFSALAASLHLEAASEAIFSFARRHPRICWETTGVGASEGSARFLAYCLGALGFPARFMASSEYLATQYQPVPTVQIAFSHGLSPNACLSLTHERLHTLRICLTGVTGSNHSRAGARATLETLGVHLVDVPTPVEPGTLVRLLSPACQKYAALALAEALAAAFGLPLPWPSDTRATLPLLYEGAGERGRQAVHDAYGDVAAIVTVAPFSELCQAETWKWREALWEAPPGCFDALTFAHGPLQSCVSRGGRVFWIHPKTDAAELLGERLRKCLAETALTLTPIGLTSPGIGGVFEVDALLSEWILVLMARRGLDPSKWPGQGIDGPLYSLGS